MAACLMARFLEIRRSRDSISASASDRAVAMARCSSRDGNGTGIVANWLREMRVLVEPPHLSATSANQRGVQNTPRRKLGSASSGTGRNIVTSTDVIILFSPISGDMHARPAGSARRQINKSPGNTSLHLSASKDWVLMYFFDSLSMKTPTPMFPVCSKRTPEVVRNSASTQSPSSNRLLLQSAKAKSVLVDQSSGITPASVCLYPGGTSSALTVPASTK